MFTSKLRQINDGLKEAFAKVRTEMDEHLDGINQNTNEIQRCYEYLSDLDARMRQLSERLDEMQSTIDPSPRPGVALTSREQEVFMLLYTRDEPVPASMIARRLGFGRSMAERYVQSLIGKGLPISAMQCEEDVRYTLDRRFKELQARENVVGVSEHLARELVDERAI